MKIEVITEKEDLVIRRMVLDPGEAMDWHIDLCISFTVVITGTRLAVEYRDSGELLVIDVYPGLADWDEPETRIHRAVNKGLESYEEIVTFFRENSSIDPQPVHF